MAPGRQTPWRIRVRMRIDHLHPNTASTHSATSGVAPVQDDSFTMVTRLSPKCPLVPRPGPPKDAYGFEATDPTRTGDVMSLANKVVLITGAGTGIGADAARAFHEAGSRVVLNGRRAAVLERTAAL